MNKNYNSILMMTIIFLATGSQALAIQAPKKDCIERKKYSFRSALGNYIMTYCVLYSAVPAVSAGAIKIAKSAPLKNSLNTAKKMNYDMRKQLLKTTLVTGPMLAFGYGKY